MPLLSTHSHRLHLKQAGWKADRSPMRIALLSANSSPQPAQQTTAGELWLANSNRS
jgi:hypothetical protein